MAKMKSFDTKPADNPTSTFLKFLFILLLMVGGVFFTYKGFSVKNNRSKSEKMSKAKKPTDLSKYINFKTMPKQAKLFADSAIKKTNEIAGVVLGEATSFAQEATSKSAELVTDFIFDNTIGGILKEIDRLPEHQKEQIQKYICK
ncbi:hypothetical protein HYW87_02160 [Candidatus Roizmanbacteria bacterium]|nr:hypothetical protein [Candidatus Roizmanbacteria bacterium]